MLFHKRFDKITAPTSLIFLFEKFHDLVVSFVLRVHPVTVSLLQDILSSSWEFLIYDSLITAAPSSARSQQVISRICNAVFT